jgi:hypothetical protein
MQIVSVFFIFPPWNFTGVDFVCTMFAGPQTIISEPKLEAVIRTHKRSSVTALLFYLPGQQDVLSNHPHTPQGFLPYDGPVRFPGGWILLKNGPTLIEWDGQNTSTDVAGIRTLVVADTLSNLRGRRSSLLEDARPAAEKV